MTLNVSRQFLLDFALLANHYNWSPAEIDEIKADTRANPDLVRYWTILAKAHRAGYAQTSENGHIRLQAWCESQGWLDPFPFGPG